MADAYLSPCLKTPFRRRNDFGRSAPVLGRSNVDMPFALEKPGAMARCTLLWPRTATLR